MVFSEPLCKVIEQYVKKGAKLYIEGALQTRKWTDKDGVEKYSTEVVLQGFNGTLTMLDGRQGGGAGAGAGMYEDSPGGYSAPDSGYGGGGGSSGGGYGEKRGGGGGAKGGGSKGFDKPLDDEIPF